MSIAHAYNDQVSVVATGHAVDYNDHTVYLGVVGHKTSLKSIWATLAQGKNVRTSWAFRTRRGLKYGKPLMQPISENPHYQQMIVMAKGAHPKDEVEDGDCFYIIHLDPEALHISQYSQRRREIAEAKGVIPKLYITLARRLNAYLPIPVLDEWGEYLWHNNGRALRELRPSGDCLAAIEVTLNTAGWQRIISTGLHDGHISF